jgi:hypothetical protein
MAGGVAKRFTASRISAFGGGPTAMRGKTLLRRWRQMVPATIAQRFRFGIKVWVQKG